MRYSTEYLYQLLPAIYRIRDGEQGEPLKALLSIIADQAAVLEKDIDGLYENWFIETCDEWVVPYLGDLLGVRDLYQVSDATFSHRARVANTLGYRRRKGTASMLEQLARDTTGWPARVVEFFQLLNTTQFMNHLRPHNIQSPNLREMNSLDLHNTPFNSVSHTLDVRHVDKGRGTYNIMNLGIYLWRLQAYPVTNAQPYSHGDGRFSFNQLGQDAPLFTHPRTEIDPTHVAEEFNVPTPIRRLGLRNQPQDYVGEKLSLSISVNGHPREVICCNLEEWSHRLPDHAHEVANGTPFEDASLVAVDPVLGRIAFPLNENPDPNTVMVSYYYGFSSEVGGGCYHRVLLPGVEAEEDLPVYAVAKVDAEFSSVSEAVDSWKSDGKLQAIIEIQDNAIYQETLNVDIPSGVTLTIRAANQHRPVVRLSDPWTIGATAPDQQGGQLLLDGLVIAGNALEIEAKALAQLRLQHCTLVPGWTLDEAGQPQSPEEPSIVTLGNNIGLTIKLSRSITGSLHLPAISDVTISDCLIDGLHSPALETGVSVGTTNPVALTLVASTLFGTVSVGRIIDASNCIFYDTVRTERTQEGCVRFCYLGPDSRVPRRFHCHPDPRVPHDTVQPRFTSRQYGHSGYGQLSVTSPTSIRSGAENQAELGVFNHLQQPQREANLRASLHEYLRVGLEAGLFYVT